MVYVNIEVVMLLVSSASRLKVEVLRERNSDRCGHSRGSVQEKTCEGLYSGG